MLIVPKIEYASVVWCPFDRTHIDLIEAIQIRYTSFFQEYQTWDEAQQRYVCTTNYWDRLKDLRIYSLERRRERFIILCVYRVMLGLMEYEGFEVYVERGIKIKTKYDKRAPACIRKIRHSSFFYKGPQIYNPLPEHLRRFEAVDHPDQSHR